MLLGIYIGGLIVFLTGIYLSDDQPHLLNIGMLAALAWPLTIPLLIVAKASGVIK